MNDTCNPHAACVADLVLDHCGLAVAAEPLESAPGWIAFSVVLPTPGRQIEVECQDGTRRVVTAGAEFVGCFEKWRAV